MALRGMPPGFRFHPTDEELVAYYLKRKAAGGRLASEVIRELELYKVEPWDLPGRSLLQTRDSEWYFFCPRDNKYMHGCRTNRSTEAGYWKATGKDRKVCSGSRTIGMKKTLVFYLGRAPRGERTDWVMHEYRLGEDSDNTQETTRAYVLCRLFKKGGPGPRNGEQYGAPLLDDENLEATSGLQGESFGASCVDQDTTALDQSAGQSDISTDSGAAPVEDFVPMKEPNVTSLFAQADAYDIDKCFEEMTSKQAMENLLGPLLLSEGGNGVSELLQNEELGAVMIPGQATETVESMLLQQTLSLAENSCIPNLEDFPPIPEAMVFGIGDKGTLDSIDDILHPAAGEAEMLEELLFSAEARQTNTESSLDNPSWHNYHQVLELQSNEGFMEGDFLELADLDSFSNILLGWPQELDFTSINETEFPPRKMETGIQIRSRHKQPSTEESGGFHEQGTALRRVRMQRSPEAGWPQGEIVDIQATEMPEFQETEGAYLRMGTQSSVYTAYEQLPVSEVTVFSSELGGLEGYDDFYGFESTVSNGDMLPNTSISGLQENSVHSQTMMDRACNQCVFDLSSSKQKTPDLLLPACLAENSENNQKQRQADLHLFPSQLNGTQQYGLVNDIEVHGNTSATNESPPDEPLAPQVLSASRSLHRATVSVSDLRFNLLSAYEGTLQGMHIEGTLSPMPISLRSIPMSDGVECDTGLDNCSVPLADTIHAEERTMVETVSQVSGILPSIVGENSVEIAVTQTEAQSSMELKQTMAILGDSPPLPPFPGQSWSDDSIRSGSDALFRCRRATTVGISLSDPLDTLQQLPAVPKYLLKLLKFLGSVPTLPASAAEIPIDLYSLSLVHSTPNIVANSRQPQYKLRESDQLQITLVKDNVACWNRFLNSFISIVKTGSIVCSRVKPSLGGSIFTLGNSFVILFFLGSASALLSCCCLSRVFWRFGKYVASVV